MASILFVLGGGIGNIIQATPAVKATVKAGHTVDLLLHCNSSKDVAGILSLSCVRNVYLENPESNDYDYQLRGPFTPNNQHCKIVKTPRFSYASHRPEAEVYYDLAQQVGVNVPMEHCEINVGEKGLTPAPDTVAIYPGSKPDWAMKRWDKYDELSKHFSNVLVVGAPQDINSHGDPAWFSRPWKWPDHVEFYSASLQEAAYTISKCKLFIGNDGGLAHVAAATGVPTYVIFGPSSDRKNKPYCPNAHVIALNLECRPCQFRKGTQYFAHRKASCPFDMKCMRDMSVEYVLSKLPKD